MARLKEDQTGLLAILSAADVANDADLMWHLFDLFPEPDQLFIRAINSGGKSGQVRLKGDLETAQQYEAPAVASNSVWCSAEERYNQAISFLLRARALKRKFSPDFLAAAGIKDLSRNRPLYRFLARQVLGGGLDPRLFPFSPEGWFKPVKMMRSLFAGGAEVAADNTLLIAEACRGQKLPRPSLPAYPVPNGLSAFEYLRQICDLSLPERYGSASEAIRERLDYELEVIGKKGLADYFLIAHDVVEFCRQQEIELIGVGSATGSVVCYLLGVTQPEPIAHDLLFERFLSVKALPDIDFLTNARRREEIFDYLWEQSASRGIYVARIATFPTFGAKGAIREVLRLFGFGRKEITQIQAQLAAGEGVPNQTKPLLRVAEELTRRKVVKSTSTHPSKVILTPEPAETFASVLGESKSRPRPVAEIDKNMAETIPNLDLLNSHPLTLISEVLKQISTETVPRNDQATLAMLFRGETVGVPYLETGWMQQVLHGYGAAANLTGLTEKDLVIAFALSRPGASSQLEVYYQRLANRDSVQFSHPVLAEVLGQTLGVIAFQEQVLLLAKGLAGFSPEEAEKLRRAMSKERSKEKMAALTGRFIQGAMAKGLDSREAKKIFAQISQFTHYGFLKGHALALMGQIGYVAAYLKCHYPQAYFETLFRLQRGLYFLLKQPGIYLEEARKRGVEIEKLRR